MKARYTSSFSRKCEKGGVELFLSHVVFELLLLLTFLIKYMREII